MRDYIADFIFVGCLVLLVVGEATSFTLFASKRHLPTSTSSALRESPRTEIDCDVAIFGGGFGGLYTALALNRLNKDINIVLVEPATEFVFLPLLYDLTVGTATEAEVCPRYSTLLRRTGIRHVQATIESINITDKTAALDPAVLAGASTTSCRSVRFGAAVMAVGASPSSILASVDGALECAQPFYTSADSRATKKLLDRLDGNKARVAVVGGGFGGVELAASIQRRLSDSQVTLLSRGKPMGGTRAETLVDQALKKLGVLVEEVSVNSLEMISEDKIAVHRTLYDDSDVSVNDDEAWDAVLWTAGSRPSLPKECQGLRKTPTGRLEVDQSLLVQVDSGYNSCVWALGDCAEIPGSGNPKTASVAVQQAPIVAGNIQKQLCSGGGGGSTPTYDSFRYNEIGSLLTLGGPNAAALAPTDGPLAPFLAAGLDIFDDVLNTADRVWEKTPVGLKPNTLGLSIGSYGVGVEDDAPGTIAGSLTGGIRRTAYAALMPTNSQRAVSLVSAAVSTAASLLREISDDDRKAGEKD